MANAPSSPFQLQLVENYLPQAIAQNDRYLILMGEECKHVEPTRAGWHEPYHTTETIKLVLHIVIAIILCLC
jgi:hypothetical protein